MKIVMVVTSFGSGGIQQVVSDLSEGLAYKGHSVVLVALLADPAGYVRSEPEGTSVVRFDLDAGSVRSYLVAAVRLRKVLRNCRPDIVHSHAIHATLVSRLVSCFCSWALVSTRHSVHEGGRLLRTLDRMTCWKSDGLYAVSKAVSARQPAPRSGRKQIIYNGVRAELVPFRHKESNGSYRRFIAVGRLTEAKDYPTMLRAWKAVSDFEPSWTLDVFGDGPLRSSLIAECLRLGVSQSVTFRGRVDNASRLMHQYDGFIQSSSWEGLPGSVIEAQLAGLPVCVTDAGGTAETIDSRTPTVAVGDFAELSVRILAAGRNGLEPVAAAKLRKAAARRFDFKVMVSEYERAYRKLTW